MPSNRRQLGAGLPTYHASIWPERRVAQAGKLETGDPDTRPMVYDGYYGSFVPVDDASFDVATTPEAIVELPEES